MPPRHSFDEVSRRTQPNPDTDCDLLLPSERLRARDCWSTDHRVFNYVTNLPVLQPLGTARTATAATSNQRAFPDGGNYGSMSPNLKLFFNLSRQSNKYNISSLLHVPENSLVLLSLIDLPRKMAQQVPGKEEPRLRCTSDRDMLQPLMAFFMNVVDATPVPHATTTT